MKHQYKNIVIDRSRDDLIDELGHKRLKDGYMIEGEPSPQYAFARAAIAFSDNQDHAQRLYDYVSQHWFMFASPILSNGGTDRGLPISCFGNSIGDSLSSISDHYDENIWLTSKGGGIGGYWGSLRTGSTNAGERSKSTGVIPFIKVVDSQMLAFSQSKTRRGSYAAYMDISHPEIEEFIGIRKPTGGDINRKCLNLHHAVVIPDKFMDIIKGLEIGTTANDDWELVDPHTKKVVKTVSAKRLWETILETRMETGEPYIMFSDNVTKAQNEIHKALGLTIRQSNLCSEILLPTGEDYNGNERTFVCCLSSVNLEKFDEWKDNDLFISDLIRMLDNVLDKFIAFAPDSIEKAKYAATMERSLGLGAMGFHAYLQSKNIPFESAVASGQNRKMFKHIWDRANEATVALGKIRGNAPDVSEFNKQFNRDITRRNVHLVAIAPNASSSILCGNTSPSIEPYAANTYRQETLSGWFIYRNKYLDRLITEKCGKLPYENMRTPKDVWKEVASHGGSIQHMTEFFTDTERDVFKTSKEIDQRWIVQHAADRYQYVDQGQSVNLFFQPDVDVCYLHRVHMDAWEKGLKTLYYCRSSAKHRAENITEKVERVVRPDYVDEVSNNSECLACSG